MAVLLTGGTGFVGRALIPKLLAKGEHIIILARDRDKAKSLLSKEVRVVQGDILLPECGVKEEIPKIDKLYHLAAIHRLSESNQSEIWETNVLGTENTLRFAESQRVNTFFFCSTAFTFARNTYEKTKMLCESMVMNSGIPQKTIFKPSIIMPMDKQAYAGHVLQVAGLLVRIHKRAETVRQYLEGELRLPVLRLVFRAPGNPDASLNLVSVEDVAKAMARIEEPGTFWLCHPSPPTVQQVAAWVGEAILLDWRIEPQFRPMPLETAFQRLGAAFLPYLWGDSFSSDIEAAPINKEFVQQAVLNYLLKV